MINKVEKQKCIDAINYFFAEGFIDELTTDKRYYVKQLLNKVANDYNIKLEWKENEEKLK